MLSNVTKKYHKQYSIGMEWNGKLYYTENQLNIHDVIFKKFIFIW